MKSVYSEEYKLLRDWLIQTRKQLPITQNSLAILLNKPQSYVSKYENGDRQLDVVEFLEVAKNLKADPLPIIQKILDEIN